MRDLAILLVFAVGLFYALRSPFIGLMIYMWISVMNPHRYAWGFAYNMQLAVVAAGVTILGLVLHPEQARFPRTRESYLFLLLWAWITLTTAFAFYPADAWVRWQLVTKIFVMVFVSMLLIGTRARLIYYLLGLVAFVGILGVKGAYFGVMTRGEQRVWGPEDSFLSDNNAAALAMVMVLPFCFFLRGTVKQKWLSFTLLCVGLCSVASILLTYSRGGLLGLAAVGAVSVLHSRRKIRIGLAAATMVVIGLSVLPPQWMGRMATIGEHEEDRSANMRLNSWSMSYNLAKANPLGGGFDCFTMAQYYRYAPDPELGRLSGGVGATAHSIYFEVLATQGFGGLAVFVMCLLSILVSMLRVRRVARKAGGQEDAMAIANAFVCSVVGFMVSGAFLSLAFFDLFWSIFAAALCFKSMVLAGQWKQEVAPGLIEPARSPGAAAAATGAVPRFAGLEASSRPRRET